MPGPFRLMLRLLPLLALAAPCAGCTGAVVLAGVEAASVTVFGRDVVDIGVSAITGRDCSVVRLDRQQTYCAPREHLPAPPPYCTRTLGTVECWTNPDAFAVLPRSVADTPALDAEQVHQVAARWPKALNLGE